MNKAVVISTGQSTQVQFALIKSKSPGRITYEQSLKFGRIFSLDLACGQVTKQFNPVELG